MRSTIVGALICLLPFPALAHHTPEHTKSMTMGDMSDPAPTSYEAPPPPEAFSGPAHAADIVFDPVTMAEAREVLRREQGAKKAYKIMVYRLEARMKEGNDDYLWDGQGWYGGDLNKLWIKTEGQGAFGEEPEDAELQALWSRPLPLGLIFRPGLDTTFCPEISIEPISFWEFKDWRLTSLNSTPQHFCLTKVTLRPASKANMISSSP